MMEYEISINCTNTFCISKILKQVEYESTRGRPSQKIKKLSDQKYLLTTFIGSHETLKNGN